MKKLIVYVLLFLFIHTASGQNTLQTVTTAGNTTTTPIISTSQNGFRNNVAGKNWDWGAVNVDSSWRLNNTGNRNVLTILSANGYVGIGTWAPVYSLDVIGTGNFSGVLSQAGKPVWHSGNFNPATYLPISGGNVSGDLIIGTTAAQKQLNVNGNIQARGIKVTQVGWADYVFDSTYQLMSLAQVEDYIQKHQHLPEVPSAKIVQAEGIDIAGNQAILLKKIEELTLYIIEQNKKNEALSRRVSEMEKQLNKK